MKRLLSFASFSLLLISAACSSNEPKTEDKIEKTTEVTINGEWTLFKEQKNGKVVDSKGKPTAVSIEFETNGYFVFFDKITDQKMIDSGVSEIQERYKGQFTLNGKNLQMNHFVNDSLITEEFEVQTLTANELVLKNKTSNHVEFYKK
ncbi:MAG: hypothetical protein RI922_2612 [Bacteroidota bacterium]|jgi:hypothetical protein